MVILSAQSFLGRYEYTEFGSPQTVVGNNERIQAQPTTEIQQTQPVFNNSNNNSSSNMLQELGWMQTVMEFRTKFTNVAWDMDELLHKKQTQQEFQRQVQQFHNYTFDISPLYDVVQQALEVLGVRGVLFDVLNDEYDHYLYYTEKRPKFPCLVSHGVGKECGPDESWWFYHYTGAIIADYFLNDLRQHNDNDKKTPRGILWDGSTGTRFTDMADLLHAIQRLQGSRYVNSASFHSQHAIIWQYVAETLPTLSRYPSELADKFCGMVHGGFARTVGKGVNHECYHGFGHAMFYVVAKRQMKRDMMMAQQQQQQQKQAKQLDFPTETPSTSARIQVRPNSGFELDKPAMCQVFQLCKDAQRSSDDDESRYPFSKGIRVCLEGVVHSVRLFSDTRHDKEETIRYVLDEMDRCAKEMAGVAANASSDKNNKDGNKNSKKTETTTTREPKQQRHHEPPLTVSKKHNNNNNTDLPKEEKAINKKSSKDASNQVKRETTKQQEKKNERNHTVPSQQTVDKKDNESKNSK